MDSIRRRDIEEFIKLFAGTETVFTSGLCYWFAHILTSKFGGEIVYDAIEGHFVSRIVGRVWDVTGDITDKYLAAPLVEWSTIQECDPKWAKRLKEGCNI